MEDQESKLPDGPIPFDESISKMEYFPDTIVGRVKNPNYGLKEPKYKNWDEIRNLKDPINKVRVFKKPIKNKTR